MISNRKLVLAAALAFLPASAFAGVHHVTATGAPGSTVTLTATFAGDGATVDTDTRLDFNNTHITITNPVGSNSGDCLVSSPTRIRITPPSGGSTPLPGAATTYCTFSVAISASATDGTFIPFTVNTLLCRNADNGDVTPCTLTATSGVTVQAAQPDVVLGFAPAAVVPFPVVTTGLTSDASIAVSVASGTIGTGTVDNCVLGGANPGSFSVISGDPTTAPPGGNIVLRATFASTAQSATLTCDVDDASPATTRVWTLNAPAGLPVPAPGYSSAPVPGTPINRTGVPNSTTQCNSTVVITNNGVAGPGSDLTYDCTVTGPAFVITSGASGTVPVNGSATVSIGATCPADGTSITDTLVCTHNVNPGGTTVPPPATYPLRATGQIVVAPVFVPASSMWSKLALFGIFAALGLLVLGLRRQH